MSTSSLLVLLVGANPLPTYLSACALRPARVALLYTEETIDAKDRLKKQLRAAMGKEYSIKYFLVEYATDATAVECALDKLGSSSGTNNLEKDRLWLNYTGGTKVMAIHARMWFERKGGKPENASYLDFGGPKTSSAQCAKGGKPENASHLDGGSKPPRLRFDNGTSKTLAEYENVSLTLEVLLALHGLTYEPRSKKAPSEAATAPNAEDAKKILRAVLDDISLAKKLYNESERLKNPSNPGCHVSKPFPDESYPFQLSVPQFPTKSILASLQNRKARASWHRQWCKFIGGEWLEEWLGKLIESLKLTPNPEIVVGVNAARGSRDVKLEVDVVVVRGHRSYFISCTTDTTKPLCKSKVFEVAIRSRQLGGDLARAALVCLADEDTTAKLRTDIDDLWGASNTTRVFGLPDIRNWSGCGEDAANTESLKKWLES